MNELTNINNINMSFFNSMFRSQNLNEKRISTPINDNIIKTKAEYLKDHQELLDKFIETSKELVRMGFKPKIVNNLFLITHFQSLLTAIDLLSKIDSKWNHEYVEGDGNVCFICEDIEKNHRNKNFILEQKKNTNSNISKLIKSNSIDHVSLLIKEKQDEEFSIKINMKSCQICFLEIQENEKFSLKCKHQYCLECIVYYIEEEIRNAKVAKIRCPSKDCSEIFNEEKIKSMVTEENFTKYKKFLNRDQIMNDPDSVLCPIVNCEGYSKIDKENTIFSESLNNDEYYMRNKKTTKHQVKYTCTNRHNFCSKCMKIWHDTSSCEDDKEILDFSTDTGKILKKCPKCKVWTEKDEGCNHMNCRLCLYDWCWLCENNCPKEHFTDRTSSCFGKQFNEEGDPDIEYFLLLQEQHNIFNSIFFFFIFSFIVINNCLRNVMLQNERNRRNRMNNDFNLGHRPNKICVFIILNLVFGFIATMLALSNGILLLYMILSITKISFIENTCAKCTCLLTFLIIYVVFYLFGIILSVCWLIVCIIYVLFKLILI